MKKYLIVIFLAFLPMASWAEISTVKDAVNSYFVVMGDGKSISVPKATENGHYKMVQKWILDGGTVLPPDNWEPTLAQAQARRIKEIKREARRIMAEHTDWYVIRKAEIGTALPAQIQNYRTSVRQTTNDAEIAINALGTINDVRDYKPIWPIAPVE